MHINTELQLIQRSLDSKPSEKLSLFIIIIIGEQ